MFIKIVNVLSPDEASEAHDTIKGLNWKQGKARTKELTGTIKKNLELVPAKECSDVKALSEMCTKRVMDHPDLNIYLLPKRATNFKFNKYTDDGAYDRHTDAPFMGDVRTDFACTLLLSDAGEYEGGELNIETPAGEVVSLKPQAGQAIIYECGAPHWVSPVTKGERISAVGWIESAIADPRKREIASCIRRTSRSIEAKMNNEEDAVTVDDLREWFVNIGEVHAKLYREWI